MGVLLSNLVHFGRLLRAAGLDADGGRMIDVATALDHVDIGQRDEFYFTLRSLLVHRHQDLPIFDEVFRLFWREPPDRTESRDAGSQTGPTRFGPPTDAPPIDAGDAPDSPGRPHETIERTAPMTYSSREMLQRRDFAGFSEEEIDAAKVIIAKLQWDLGLRQTRRWTPGDGRAVDLRRVVRRNLRYGGEPVILPGRERLLKRRPLVLICDVSGSMERYSRMLLHFAHSMTSGLDRVEVFLFATRLTRVTHELARRGVEQVVPEVLRRVPDWGGGTRIGDALRTFNVRWARRVLGHGPVVLLISDGWDRGEPEVLRSEMARLHRSSHRLIWLNPLLGSPTYRPLTRGMEAALPFVDDFLPVHNLVSLESLASHLNALPARRSRGRLRMVGTARASK